MGTRRGKEHLPAAAGIVSELRMCVSTRREPMPARGASADGCARSRRALAGRAAAVGPGCSCLKCAVQRATRWLLCPADRQARRAGRAARGPTRGRVRAVVGRASLRGRRPAQHGHAPASMSAWSRRARPRVACALLVLQPLISERALRNGEAVRSLCFGELQPLISERAFRNSYSPLFPKGLSEIATAPYCGKGFPQRRGIGGFS